MTAEVPNDRAQIRLLRRAARHVVINQLASAESLARWFDIPQERAAQLLEDLEAAGIVGPSDLGPSRSVLHTPDAARTIIDEKIPRPS